MQTMYANINGSTSELVLPAPDSDILAGVCWGTFDTLLTPAYWKGQAWQHQQLGTYSRFRLGRSLTEELAACLLGGYGMPAEIGLAAFARLRDMGMLEAPHVSEVEAALSRPFVTSRGSSRKYRFPRQKARYLCASLEAMRAVRHFPICDVELRDLLVDMPGVGPKTASWIVRNHRGSDAVAIIDVHVLRAGRHIGIFAPSWNPTRHYVELEAAFLDFARALDVPASMLDSLIWDYMRRLGVSYASPRGQPISAAPRAEKRPARPIASSTAVPRIPRGQNARL